MAFLQTLLLSAIEGVTEFLPVSSTGHLILGSKALGIQPTDFVKSFEIIIQLGAIFSIIFMYWKEVLENKEIFKKIIIAFLPTGLIGLVFYKIVKSYLLGSWQVVAWSFLIGGIAMIFFEYFYKDNSSTRSNNLNSISYKQAFIIGIFQSLAIVPGVSRAAATILGGLALGIKRRVIVVFSFLLAVPTMLAASSLDILKNYSLFSKDQVTTLFIGFMISFITAIIAVKFLLGYIKKHTFIPFGIYRIFAALLALIIFL